MKLCRDCACTLPLDAFPKDRSAGDGHHRYCRLCVGLRGAAYRGANPGKELARAVRYRAENPDKRRVSTATYRKDHPEKYQAYSAAWRAANPDKALAAQAAYRDAHPDRRRANNGHRRASKLRATPGWANRVKMAEFYFAADFLGMVTGDWYHVDHVVPLRSKFVCGLHTEQNLRVIPGADNLAKGNRHWPDMP